MRKLIIIGVLILLAAWLLLMPVLVGVYLRDAVPEWLAEWSEPQEADYEPGLFGSRLHWQPEPEIRLDLTARHFPPGKPGWLALEGQLDWPLTPQGADLRAHLGLTGSWHVSATANRLQPLPNGQLLAHRVSLNIAQPVGGPLSLVLNADQLDLPDQDAPLLDVRLRSLRREGEDGRIRLGVDLQARDRELGAAALTLQAGPMDPAQLELLVQGLGQLAESSPGSMAEGMALVTVAGAWQEMAAAGMVIELERLTLGDQTRFQGRWRVAEPSPAITGSGSLDGLERWLQRLIPAERIGDADASEGLIGELSRLGDLEIENGRFRFSSRQRPDPAAPRPSSPPRP